jgi:hypothetical protein
MPSWPPSTSWQGLGTGNKGEGEFFYEKINKTDSHRTIIAIGSTQRGNDQSCDSWPKPLLMALDIVKTRWG